MKIVVGITGASGSLYACSLLQVLQSLRVDVTIVLSEMGRRVMEYECGATAQELSRFGEVCDNADLFSPIASGSCKYDGMVVVPCSMNTLGAMACGLGDTLLLRAASVALKERRKLVAVVRETPYSLVHIENMAQFTRAGGVVLPASPGFYNRPTEIWQLTESISCRILDTLGIENDLGNRWKGGQPR